MNKAELAWLDARIRRYRKMEEEEKTGAETKPPSGSYAVAGLFASSAGALEEFRRAFFKIPKGVRKTGMRGDDNE